MNTRFSNNGTNRSLTLEAVRRELLAEIPAKERNLNLSGISTAVLEGGIGEPVVLLHGPGESAIWWMRVIPELVKTHRVVAPDLPGHGASKLGNEKLDIDRICEWLDDLIEQTCPSPPVLVGHILGGAIAARFAIRNGNRIQRLVLVDSFGLAKFRPSPQFAFGLIKFLMRPSEKTHNSFFPQCIFDADSLQKKMGKNWQPFMTYNLALARDPDATAAMRFFIRQYAIAKIPDEDLAGIDIPTTLIWGRHDKALKLRIAEAASRRFGWKLHIIDDARDDPKLEQPESFLRALYTVLEPAVATL